jgi:hypothetical protein
MFATTKQARAILRLAFKEADCQVSHTYTEKTSETDTARRSVVFPIHIDDAEDVMHFATAMFEETGYTESMPKLSICKDYSGYIRAYIRVIAYKNV